MTFLYVGNAGTSDISAFRVHRPDGRLTAIGTYRVPAMEPNRSSPLAVSPDRRILFVGIRNPPWSACSFAINDSTGELEYLGAGPMADDSCYISCDRTGRFLLTASYQGDNIAVTPIGADGIAMRPAQIIHTEPHSHAVVVDPANRYAFSTCLGGDLVYQWRFDATSGRLTPNEPPFVAVRKHSGPRHFVFHPNGRFAYLLTEQAATIYVYQYDPDNGTLREKQVVEAWPTQPGNPRSASDIRITPDARFLYAAERGSSTLGMLRVGEDGMLSLIGHFVTETQPRGFAIDPAGRSLYCAGQLSGRLAHYEIDTASGNLKGAGNYGVGVNPNWVEIVECP